jgi:hypothetical protein
MYAISSLKHVVVVLSKSEGPQKWLAPCGTDVRQHQLQGDVQWQLAPNSDYLDLSNLK